MNIKLLNEHHLEFLSLKGGCIGLSVCIHVKVPHCWKSHVTAQISIVDVASPGMNYYYDGCCATGNDQNMCRVHVATMNAVIRAKIVGYYIYDSLNKLGISMF